MYSSGDARYYALLVSKLEELIEASETYLFNIYCSKDSIGEKYAHEFGAGLIYFDPPPWVNTLNEIQDHLIKECDYAIVFYDGKDAETRNFIMKMKSAGKHGSVIKI